MQTVLTINGQDFLPFLAEDGISYSTEARNQRSVITMNGLLHRAEINKYSLSVTCVNVYDEALGMILSALSTSPANVIYTDRKTRQQTSGSFYVDDISFTENRIVGNGTEISDISFTLTPR